MSSSSVAICGFDVFMGGHGSSTSHPMIVPSFTQPFTLLPFQSNEYKIGFFNRISANARVYAKGFTSTNTLWWSSLSVPKETPNQAEYSFLKFTAANLNGSTNLWIGSWWDDGTYPGTEAGVITYFTDHPETPGHHTVPILVGG